jgi:hypothetical protein
VVIEQRIKLQSGGLGYRLPSQSIYFEDSTDSTALTITALPGQPGEPVQYGWNFGGWTQSDNNTVPGSGFWTSATADYWAVTRVVITPMGGELFVKPDDAERGWFSDEFYSVASRQWSHSRIEKVRFTQPWDSVNYLNYFRVYTNNRGDVDGNLTVDLADAILTLKVIGGLNPPAIRTDYTSSGVDVKNDGKIGLSEVIYILQAVAGMR